MTTESIPIFAVGGRYLLYDVNVVMQLRREHHICGVLIGNIPSANQQNIFSGIPVELLPEEALLLVDGRHAHVVDDAKAHAMQLRDLNGEDRQSYRHVLEEEGMNSTRAALKQAEESKIRGLKRMKEKKGVAVTENIEGDNSDEHSAQPEFELFARDQPSPSMNLSKALEPNFITPTTSYPPLKADPSASLSVTAPASYPLFRYLHKNGYWMTPGLRFGCQYSVYPGDPLRFHSHFLATGAEWDEEIDLMDIVGGGRLGTGVKKSFLLGGQQRSGEGGASPSSSTADEADGAGGGDDVRVFCFEWAAM